MSYGRQMRELALAAGTPPEEAERGGQVANELAEQAYRDELY